jgi:hypothetical protein
MSNSFSNSKLPDPLTAQLREQAQSFDPEPPAGLHRRIVSAIAQADASPRPSHWRLGWLFAAGTVAAAVLVAVLVLRDHSTSPIDPPRHIPARFANLDPTVPNPLALALQYVDDPLQNEAENLLKDLSRASTTVTHVFPGAAKRQQRPASQNSRRTTGV